ncbi:MAG: D-alanyl-D-alanine carboxypeptidase [Lachnospiraceae bacterium]|nr:D-alanyl-D-alanine carboxypeptidase [Lachnospiraceae bacterium]
MERSADRRTLSERQLASRRLRLRRKRQRAAYMRLALFGAGIFLCFMLLFVSVRGILRAVRRDDGGVVASAEAAQVQAVEELTQQELAFAAPPEEEEEEQAGLSEEVAMFFDGYEAKRTERTVYLAVEEVQSQYGVIVDVETGEVMAGREDGTIINPASMTKILTLLVAVEELEKQEGRPLSEEVLSRTTTVTQEICDFTYSHDCSQAGFMPDEEVSIRDLLYGTILPSGGDAAMTLAAYAAGSEEAFVARMNEKLAALGLSSTAHFTNSVGLYDPDHHCTVTDMAMILKAALENDLCRQVLSEHRYVTSKTAAHPDGIDISNWFLRRIEDKDNHGEVMSAKTGYVAEAGCCAASYQIADDGHHHICVTANAWSAWRAIYDHVAIYQTYTGKEAGVRIQDAEYESNLESGDVT